MSIWLSLNSSNLCTACLELLQNALMWHTYHISCHMLDIFGVGGWIYNICMGLFGIYTFLGCFFYCVCLQASSHFANIKTCLLEILLGISYRCKLIVYLCFHVVIIYTIDKLLFFSPITFLIIALFAAILSLFIHSSAFSLLCLVSLWNCRI